MGWKLIGKPQTVVVTKQLAQQYADMDPAPHDRPLSERRLVIYRKILAEGGFRPVSWASALCAETGGLYRVNGKHTSTMLAAMPKIPLFYAVLEEYECDTLDDVARLYSTFDSSVQSRTARDVYLSFAAAVPELKEVSTRAICLAVAGMEFHETGAPASGVSQHRQAPDRAERLLDYPNFVIWLDGILGNKTNKQEVDHVGKRAKSTSLQRASVVAAMFGTWQRDGEAATKFWCAVRDETGTSPGTPDRKLAKYLMVSGVRSSVQRTIRTSSTREMYVKCLHAWNAWRRGETTNLNYYPDKELPAIK